MNKKRLKSKQVNSKWESMLLNVHYLQIIFEFVKIITSEKVEDFITRSQGIL